MCVRVSECERVFVFVCVREREQEMGQERQKINNRITEMVMCDSEDSRQCERTHRMTD